MTSTTAALLNPEEEAFKALLSAISMNCITQKTTSRIDIDKIVQHYKPRYPQLTAELIEEGIVQRIPFEKPPNPPPKRIRNTGRRKGRPSKRSLTGKERAAEDGLLVTDEEVAAYEGEEGGQKLMDELLASMPDLKFDKSRYEALENHVQKYEVGHLDGFGASTFHMWITGSRTSEVGDVENRKAILSYIKGVYHSANIEDDNDDGYDDDTTDDGSPMKKKQRWDEKRNRWRKLCKVVGCTLNSSKDGLCNRHGKGRKLCKMEGCTKQANRWGLCHRHGGKRKVYPRKECSVEGCTNQAVGQGICRKHGAVVKQKKNCSTPGCKNQAIAGNDVCIRHGAVTTKTKICSVEGCENKVVKAGVCRKHSEPCKHPGCTNNVVTKGLCIRHGGKEVKICAVYDCNNKVYSRGVCQRHGHKPPPVCKHPEGCKNLAKRRGYCGRHAKEMDLEEGREYTPLVCKRIECNNVAKQRGYCTRHFKHWHLQQQVKEEQNESQGEEEGQQVLWNYDHAVAAAAAAANPEYLCRQIDNDEV